MVTKPRLLRITTVPISLKLLLQGQFTFFQQQGFEVLTVSASGEEIAYLTEQGIEHKVVPLTRSITPLQDLLCLWHLINIIQKFRPHIVHTHTPKAGLLGMLAARICQVPVRMHTVAGLPLMETSGLKRTILNVTERITYACATRVYPNSKGLRDFIARQFKMKPAKLKIIGKGSSNGIDNEFFSRNFFLQKQADAIRQQFGIKESEVVYCFVGRLVQDKGLVELVKAFQQIQQHKDSRLLLVGAFEEDLDPLPKEIMNFLKNDKRVVLAGFQNDVRPWMMAADVFVFPSYREGFPNVVMQAACLEVPCIVTDINGCNELIVSGNTGWIVPVKNIEKLFEAMKAANSDRAKARQMAIASREWVVANFSRDYVWAELLKEYKYLLDQLKN